MKTNVRHTGSSLHRFTVTFLLAAAFAFVSFEASAFTFIFSTTPVQQAQPATTPPPHATMQGYKPGVVHNQKAAKAHPKARTLFGKPDRSDQFRPPVTNSKPQNTPPGAPGLPRK